MKDFCPSFQGVQVIRPGLHHNLPFWKVGRAVIGPAQRIAHGMGQLMFYEVGPEAQDLIKDGAGHRPKAVPGLLRFGVYAHAPHGRVYGVVGYGPRVGSCRRKHIRAGAGERVKLPQERHRLFCQRDNVGSFGLVWLC